MNDPVATYIYWYYLGGVVLLALLGVGFFKWFNTCNKQNK